jgi:DNA-binding GntR family transcriptional regulator
MSAALAAYQRIANDLRAQITSGGLEPGALLPSQQDLQDQYGVARMTVRQAITVLVNEGLVTTQQGKGVMVRNRQHMVYRPQAEHEPRIGREMDRFMSHLSRDGRTLSQTIEVSVVNASRLIAQRLDVASGAAVVVRKRVRSLDGEPFDINDTYYPYELAQGTEIMSPVDIPRGSNVVLADHGYREVRAVDEIYVRMPRPDEVQRLSLSPGTPVAAHYVTGYTAKDEPVRCDVFILPGDRHVILFERTHPSDGDEGTGAAGD